MKDPVSHALQDELFHDQEGGDRDQLLERQVAECILQVKNPGDFSRDDVVTRTLTRAVSPLGQANHRVGTTGGRQEQVIERLG